MTRAWCRRSADTVLGTALVLLYFTGLRTGEVLRLTMADVDLTGGVLRVRDTKFGKSRLVPITSDVAARLDRCRTTIERQLGSRTQDAPFFRLRPAAPTPTPRSPPHSTKCSRVPTFLVTALAVPFASTTSVTASRC